MFTCCRVVEAAHCYRCLTAINLRSVVLTCLEPRLGPTTLVGGGGRGLLKKNVWMKFGGLKPKA